MADVLMGAGYEVEWTTAASVAVERVAAHRCSLVVSDVNMPHMLGTELAAELAKIEPRLPILLVSAFADRRIQAEARALDAMLLAKPIRAEALLAAVRSLLGDPVDAEVVP
jgi:CheY-like chemotaxis protein